MTLNKQCRYCGIWQEHEFWACTCLNTIYDNDPWGVLVEFTENNDYVLYIIPDGIPRQDKPPCTCGPYGAPQSECKAEIHI